MIFEKLDEDKDNLITLKRINLENLGTQLSTLILPVIQNLQKNSDKMIKKKEFIEKGLTQFQVSAIFTQYFV